MKSSAWRQLQRQHLRNNLQRGVARTLGAFTLRCRDSPHCTWQSPFFAPIFSERLHMRSAITILIIMISALTTGCANLVAPSYSADYAAVDNLKHSKLNKMALGKVQPDDVRAKVNQISLRGANLTAGDTTFAGYLERAMTNDLQEAGLYDASAAHRIDIVLIKNDIDVSGFSQGVGQIEIELTLTASGKIVLKKNYATTTQFESSFAAAVAVPKGQIEYPNLVRALLSKIYRDQAFLLAMQIQ